MGVGRHHDAGTRLYLEKEGRTDSEGNGGGAAWGGLQDVGTGSWGRGAVGQNG